MCNKSNLRIYGQIFRKAIYPEQWYGSGHYFGISSWLINNGSGENSAQSKILTGKWCRIESTHGVIYRVIRFQPQLSAGKNEKEAEISLDYDGGRIVGFNSKGDNGVLLSIRRIYLHEYILATLCHPDPSYRVACWLGLIALGLGVISVILGIIPFIKK